jgi:hypothetical protein
MHTDNGNSVRDELVAVELYGGAIVSSLPKRFEDVSQLRHIPDHQEVYADNPTDQSIIFELNQLEAIDDEKAIEYHLNDIAEANEAFSTRIIVQGSLEQKQLPNIDLDGKNCSAYYGIGEQVVSKYHECVDKANTIQVFMVCIRLKLYNTDFLIIFNVPTFISPHSASHQAQIIDTTLNQATLNSILNSIKIVDYGLFGAQKE